jgi:hypothetical protein
MHSLDKIPLLLAAGLLVAALAPPASGQVTFTRTDSTLGVNLDELSYGPTWGDINGDGFEDLFSGNHCDVPNLYLNVLGGALEDIWQISGISPSADRHGAAWGDMDNDGLRDLYVAIGAQNGQGVGLNQLYHNLTGAIFEDLSLSSGTVDSLGRGRFAYWIDANNDGRLDVFVGNVATPNRLFLNQGDYTFEEVPDAGGLGVSDRWYAAWTHFNPDRLLDVALGGAWYGRLALFRNDGDGTFTDLTASCGLPSHLMNVTGLCWIDYDNDGFDDLYCSRGLAGDGTDAYWTDSVATVEFMHYLPTDPEKESGADQIAIAAAGSGLTVKITIDWDGRPFEDIYLGAAGQHPQSSPFYLADGAHLGRPPHAPGSSFGLYIWQDAEGGPYRFEGATNYGAEHRIGGTVTVVGGTVNGIDAAGIEAPFTPPNVDDRLFHNRGNGSFEDVTAAAGIADSLDGHNVISADFDLDGWPDLYVVNARSLSGYLTQNGPNLLYLNNRDGTFRECAEAAGVANRVPGTGGGAGWADYDDDGAPDLFVTNGWGAYPFNRGPQVIYHNQGNGNHWIKVHLVGTVSNRDGTGARVLVQAGGRTQRRSQFGGVNDLGQSSMDLIFGLGASTVIDGMRIDWPSGTSETYGKLEADRGYTFTEGQNSAVADPPPTLRLVLAPPAPNPLRDRAALRYALPAPGRVRLDVFDAAGRCVRTLVDGAQSAGSHTILWDGRDGVGRRLGRGIYCTRLRGPDGATARRRLVVD